jgi:hypothetical protein
MIQFPAYKTVASGELVPKFRHINVNCTERAVALNAPKFVHKLRPRERLFWVRQQLVEEIELPKRQINRRYTFM